MKVVQTPAYLAAVMGLVALAGCASPRYEDKYAWSEGWRKAEVVSVQTAAELERPRFYTCVRNAGAEQSATTSFAVVKYRQFSRTQRWAVPVEPGHALAAGQAVYVKVDDCSTQPVAADGGRRR